MKMKNSFDCYLWGREGGTCVMLTLYGSGLLGKQVMSSGKSNSNSAININVHLLIT